jgi:glycine/D-amino acid oxidase-like deaminating enzyme
MGSVAALMAQNQGHDVTVFDDGRPLSGSAPSAGLLAPSWMSKWSKADVHQALDDLDCLYGLRDVKLGKLLGVKQCSPSQFLWRDPETLRWERVLEVSDGRVVTGNDVYEGHVLVTAGAWCGDLLPRLKPLMYSKWGVSYTWLGTVTESVFEVWAPYKQTKVIQWDPGVVWGGDSRALKWPLPGEPPVDVSRERILKAAGLRNPPPGLIERQGLRPFVKGWEAGYFEQVHSRTWVATGGGKSGTIIAPMFARRFLEAL